MKVLGLSFGRKMKNCEILVKQALMGAEAAGAEVTFLRTINLKVGHCIGCGGCGKGTQIKCILKDDYLTIEEAVLDADAIIVAAPVYALGPVGQYKNFLDRFGPAHDRMALEAKQEARIANGEELLDARYFKRRFISYISVGGAHTPNWVSYGLPGMHLMGFSTWMKPLDQIDAYNMGHTGNPILDKELMKRAYRMGEVTAAALSQDPETVEWAGEPGTCPVCHCNHITFNGTTTVECPICGIYGKLSMDGDKVRIDFSPEEQARSRYTRAGLKEHYLEIQGMGAVAAPKIMANKEMLDQELKRFSDYLAGESR